MQRVLVPAAAVVVILLVIASAAFAATPRLSGSVGPGYTISLKKGGKSVKSLKKGTYSITVVDKASIHNFVLEGPGVERQITSVPFKGTKTVTVKLLGGEVEVLLSASRVDDVRLRHRLVDARHALEGGTRVGARPRPPTRESAASYAELRFSTSMR